MLYNYRLQWGAQRFIPTWVGNAKQGKAQGGSAAVHPHVGGECDISVGVWWRYVGSSPRGWGMLTPTRILATTRRFIPTWVGNAL